jgi:hypothetical protein
MGELSLKKKRLQERDAIDNSKYHPTTPPKEIASL